MQTFDNVKHDSVIYKVHAGETGSRVGKKKPSHVVLGHIHSHHWAQNAALGQ